MPNQHTHARFQDLGLDDQDLQRLSEPVQGCWPDDDFDAGVERLLNEELDAPRPCRSE